MEVLAARCDRYGSSSKSGKGRILDEFVSLSGDNRNYASRLPQRPVTVKPRNVKVPAGHVYDQAVRDSLIVLWEASDRICSKRLRAILPTLIESLEVHDHLQLEPVLRNKLLTISPVSIDRVLRPVREHARGRRRPPRRRNRPSRSVPIRTFADWQNPDPGYLEVGLLAHCGGAVSGNFIGSLAVTDVATGWVETVPLLAREQTLVTAALDAIAERQPVPIRGIDSDNDSVFIRGQLIDYCRERSMNFTRSRAYRSGRPSLHRAEERSGGTTFRRTRSLLRPARRASPGPVTYPGRSLRQFLPNPLPNRSASDGWEVC